MTELSDTLFKYIKDNCLNQIKPLNLKSSKFSINGQKHKDLRALIEDKEIIKASGCIEYFLGTDSEKAKVIADVSDWISRELRPAPASNPNIDKVLIQYKDLVPCLDLESEGEYVMLSNNTGWTSTVTYKSWKEIMSKEEVDVYMQSKRVCIRRYLPYSLNKYMVKTSKDFGGNFLEINTCVQPEWRYSVDKYELRKDFLEYFNGLFSSQESRQYAINWLDESVYGRNGTYLVLCGKKGIGKNILSEAMSYMVGLRNYTEAPRSALTKEFNTYLKDKRLVLLDEISFREPAEKDKLKSYLNNFQAVEGKGVEAKLIELYCSIILSSNNAKDMNIEPDDRRFSVMDLTSTSLIDKIGEEGIEDLIEYIRSEEFPLAFNAFLQTNREKDFNPNRPYKGETFRELCLTTLTIWQNAIYEAINSKSKDSYYLKDIMTQENRNFFPKRHKDYQTFLENFTVDEEVIAYYDRGLNITDSLLVPHTRYKANLKSDL